MGVTLQDVARLAGTSSATVSRVINGHEHVSEATREAVLKAIAELGYKFPARRNNQHANTLLMLLPNLASPFFQEILRGAEETAHSKGYYLVVHTTDGRNKETMLAEWSDLKIPSGIILVTTDPNEFGSLVDKFPIVVLDYGSEGSSFPHITVDNLRAGHLATKYLIERGHKEIGIITGPLELQSAVDRLRGFRLALDEAGLTPRPQWIKYGDFTLQAGYELTLELLNQPPTALFCCNDWMAIGALQALRENQIKCPEEICLIGFDNQLVSTISSPQLTTMAQPMFELGEIAVRVLLRLMGGEELETNRIVLDTQLIVRESA